MYLILACLTWLLKSKSNCFDKTFHEMKSFVITLYSYQCEPHNEENNDKNVEINSIINDNKGKNNSEEEQ